MPAPHLELVEALRSRQILEPELSEIACGSGQQLLRRRRQKHLAAVRRRADPGRLVNVEPEVHVLHQQGLPGVKSHPAAHRFRLRPRMTGERALALGRGRRAGVRLREGDEEGVALPVDLDPAVTREHVAQQGVVVGDHGRPAWTELVGEPGRSLDIGEQQRHPAGGQLPHRGVASRGQPTGRVTARARPVRRQARSARRSPATVARTSLRPRRPRVRHARRA